jgi:hypothetical protein
MMEEKGRTDQIETAREGPIPRIMLEEPDVQPCLSGSLKGELHGEEMQVARLYPEVDSFSVCTALQRKGYISSAAGNVQDAEGNIPSKGQSPHYLPDSPGRKRQCVDPAQRTKSFPVALGVQIRGVHHLRLEKAFGEIRYDHGQEGLSWKPVHSKISPWLSRDTNGSLGSSFGPGITHPTTSQGKR